MTRTHMALCIAACTALAPQRSMAKPGKPAAPPGAQRQGQEVPALSLKKIDVADAVLRQAEQEEARGNYQLAVELYRKALELQPDLRINFPLGRCLLKLNQLTEAANAFQRFLTVPCEYSPRYWCEEARGALSRLRGQLGMVRPEGPAGTLFRVDQGSVQEMPMSPFWVAPGAHHVALLAQAGQRQVSVRPGQELRIDLLSVLVPERPRWRLISGSALLASGVAAVVAGVVTLGVNNNPHYCGEPDRNLCGSREAFNWAGGWLVGIGGALSIGGAGLVLYPPARRAP